MNDKSYVSLERRVCLVCGVAFDTGNLLLDKRLRASMDRHTTTGWGLCAEHQKLFDDGYIALVECDPERSGLSASEDRVKPGDAYRTGRVAHLKREAFAKVFARPLATEQPCVFIDAGVFERLKSLVAPPPN
ncbi:TPA: ATPase [Stenotrophomonas maltophilia]|nr:ATPase [Stenotrophomonas maltophilia]